MHVLLKIYSEEKFDIENKPNYESSFVELIMYAKYLYLFLAHFDLFDISGEINNRNDVLNWKLCLLQIKYETSKLVFSQEV